MSRDITSDAKHDVIRVQEQLLDLLRSAGQEAPPPRRELPVVSAASAMVAATATAAPAKAPAAAVNITGAPPAAGEDCPKCGSDTPWGRSSWCPDCGYFPKAGFEGTGIVEEDDGPPPTLLSVFPAWVLPTLTAAIGIFISSVITRFVFHDALQRSLVAMTQLLVFTATAFAVHSRASYIAMQTGKGWMAFVNPGETWAMMLGRMPATRRLILLLGCSLSGMGSSFLIGLDVDLVAEEIRKEVKDNPKVTFSDIVGAMTKMTSKAFGDKKKNLAMSAFGNLMQATGQMSGGGGGGSLDGEDREGSIGALAGTASIITDNPAAGGGNGGDGGGLESAIGDLGGTASALTQSDPSGSSGGNSKGDSDKSSGESSSPAVVVRSTPQTPGSSTPSGTTPTPEAVPPTESKTKGTYDYWIYGYTTNPDGELRSLLLATTAGAGKLRFSQKFGIDELGPEALAKICEQLKPYRTSSAAVTSPYGGKWVKPVTKCRVEHEGLNADSRPINPKFQKVVLP